MEKIDANIVSARRLGIDTRKERVLFLRSDAAVARSEGFEAMSQVKVETDHSAITATLMFVSSDFVSRGDGGLSEMAWQMLDVKDGEQLNISHPPPLDSLSHVRAKIYGHELNSRQWQAIMQDIGAGHYLDVHLAALLAACANDNLTSAEIISLTGAMVSAGARLSWPAKRVFDKHSVGGLPGNRTTPIIVPIGLAAGLTIPKTSSRAITSPAGTADCMETLTTVDLSLTQMRQVVELTGGCLVWGGAVSLSPADDRLVRVERAINVDSEGQLVASVLSKKIAAGSTDVIIDIPVGETAKIRDGASADRLTDRLVATGAAFGLNVQVMIGDGSQPIGRGIGPALEARDVVAVLTNDQDAPADLRERALALAGGLLESAEVVEPGAGCGAARDILNDGRAWASFQAVCEAQGGMKELTQAPYRYEVFAEFEGKVRGIDNRKLATLAKLAGAPADQAAGVDLHVRLDQTIQRGTPILTVHAESPGELEYALHFHRAHAAMIEVVET